MQRSCTKAGALVALTFIGVINPSERSDTFTP